MSMHYLWVGWVDKVHHHSLHHQHPEYSQLAGVRKESSHMRCIADINSRPTVMLVVTSHARHSAGGHLAAVEYVGMHGAEKTLVCDFFCQPEAAA